MSFTIHDTLIDYDRAQVRHTHNATDVWEIESRNTGTASTLVYFDRAQAHALHAWLTVELGLVHPRVTHPVTASVPHGYNLPDHEGEAIEVEQPDCSGNASRTVLPGTGNEDVT